MIAHFPGCVLALQSGRVKLVLWAQTSTLSEMMRLCKCFPHVDGMTTLTYRSERQRNDYTFELYCVIKHE